jgi:hypothetical protein
MKKIKYFKKFITNSLSVITPISFIAFLVLTFLFFSVSVSRADTTPLVITLTDVSTTASAATITWTTDRPANSVIKYGVNMFYGSVFSLDALVTSHSATLNDLTLGQTYHFRLESTDANGIALSRTTILLRFMSLRILLVARSRAYQVQSFW